MTLQNLQNQCDMHKIILVGDSSVGKTSIIRRYCDGNFIEYYNPDVGIDLKKKTIFFEDKTTILHIWDTAGSEKYCSLANLYYRGAMGIFLVYDVTNFDSFLNLDTWMKCIENYAPQNVVKILVGSKCDNETNTVVSTENGKMIAKHYGIPFIEVSSKTNINVEFLFLTMVSMINEVKDENDIEKDFVILTNEPIPDEVSSDCKCYNVRNIKKIFRRK